MRIPDLQSQPALVRIELQHELNFNTNFKPPTTRPTLLGRAPARRERPLPAAAHAPDQAVTGFGPTISVQSRYSLFKVVALLSSPRWFG